MKRLVLAIFLATGASLAQGLNVPILAQIEARNDSLGIKVIGCWKAQEVQCAAEFHNINSKPITVDLKIADIAISTSSGKSKAFPNVAVSVMPVDTSEVGKSQRIELESEERKVIFIRFDPQAPIDAIYGLKIGGFLFGEITLLDKKPKTDLGDGSDPKSKSLINGPFKLDFSECGIINSNFRCLGTISNISEKVQTLDLKTVHLEITDSKGISSDFHGVFTQASDGFLKEFPPGGHIVILFYFYNKVSLDSEAQVLKLTFGGKVLLRYNFMIPIIAP